MESQNLLESFLSVCDEPQTAEHEKTVNLTRNFRTVKVHKILHCSKNVKVTVTSVI